MNEMFKQQNIIFQYLEWQYFLAPKNILIGWRNFFLFNLNYFSVFPLLRTLFSPWRRYVWIYPKGFDIGKYFEVLISNLISRVLGAIMRSSLIIIALFIEILIFLGGIVILISWILLPLVLIFGFILGFNLLF